MRSFRQIVHGCKKHKYRYFRRIRWYEDEYRQGMRSRLICIHCFEIVDTDRRIMDYGFLLD